MNRRTFLVGVGAAAVLPRLAGAQGLARADAGKLSRLSIMTFNFTPILRLPNQPESPARTLDIADVPEMLADRYGVHNIEFQHAHIQSTEPSALQELRARVEKVKSRITQVNLEFGQANFSSPDPDQRARAVQLSREWVDHAVALGCGRVMLNQGQLTPEKREFSIPTLKSIADYATSKGVKASMETRAPSPTTRGRGTPPLPAAELPTPPAWVVDDATRAAWLQGNPGPPPAVPTPRPTPAWVLLLEHIKATGSFSNPDVGGMGAATQEEMNDGLRALLPVSSGQMHINWRENPQWDLATTVRFTRELGYQGLYVMEVAGAQDPNAVTLGLCEAVVANL